MLKWLLIQVCTSAIALAQMSSVEVRATTPRGVATEDVQLTLFLDGSTAEIPCKRMGSSGLNEPLFFCYVKPGVYSAMFRFSMPGYKPYSVNVASLNAKDSLGDVRLGVLHPIDSDEPRIENIVSTRGNDRSIRFQITVNNLSKKQFLITQLRMEGTADPTCGVGHEPPVYFKVSERLQLTPSKSGKVGISGTIADPSDHPDFPAQVTGTGVFHDCGHNEFSLSAPMNFTIPAQDYFEIELLIPSDRNPRRNSDRDTSRTSPTTMATSDVVVRFHRIRFTLATSDKDQSEIKAYYYSSYGMTY
jgi:hypothetical protein